MPPPAQKVAWSFSTAPTLGVGGDGPEPPLLVPRHGGLGPQPARRAGGGRCGTARDRVSRAARAVPGRSALGHGAHPIQPVALRRSRYRRDRATGLARVGEPRRPVGGERGHAFGEVRAGHHDPKSFVGVARRGGGVAVEVGVELELGGGERRGRDLGRQHAGVVVARVAMSSSARRDRVDEPDLGRLLGQDDPARQQHVGGPGEAHQAGQQPRQPELGGKAEPAVGRGQLGPGGGEAKVAVSTPVRTPRRPPARSPPR